MPATAIDGLLTGMLALFDEAMSGLRGVRDVLVGDDGPEIQSARIAAITATLRPSSTSVRR